jgi:hypothetical protein
MTAAEQYAAAMQQLTAARTGQMLDTGIAVRPASAGQTPTLDADGKVTAAAGEPVYDGPCTVSDPADATLAGRTTNDQSGVPTQRQLKLPIDSAALLPGDLFTVTASRFSPGLVGDVFVVVGEDERSFATYRRYRVRGSSWLPEAGP